MKGLGGEEMKRELCFVAFVYGKYTKYIPYYIYSILRSYPNFYVKIFVNDSLNINERNCLNMIRKKLSNNFEVKENFFKQFNFDKWNVSEEGRKAIRFLIPRKEFIEFQNVYFGDIDFLIFNENPGILEGHLSHCEKVGLPYSNLVRKNSHRLTGLHFFKVEEYYNKMDKIINNYLEDKEMLVNQLSKIKWDEEFLYKIVEEGIGFGQLAKYDYRPHHGFHIGCIRHGKIIDGYLENGQSNVVHLLPSYEEIKEKLSVYFKDPLFLDMLELIPDMGIIKLSNIILNKNVDKRLRRMQIKNNFRIKQYRALRLFRKIIKQTKRGLK